MKYLSGTEEKEAELFLDKAAGLAKQATCSRSKCGSIIVKGNEIIGTGFNSPSGNNESQRRCRNEKDSYHKKITDKTCCMHAEQRAIMEALKKNHDKLKDARLYFIRLDDSGAKSKAGNPYCTMCSKMALDSGIKEFVLWHEDGICVYDTQEYNDISYKYDGDNRS